MPPKQENNQQQPKQTKQTKQQSNLQQDGDKIVKIPLVTLKKFRGIFEVASNRVNWTTAELLPVGLIVRDIDMLINHFSNPPSQDKKEKKEEKPKV